MAKPDLQPKSAAIMQPTFLPWMGYFALMDSVDLFVLLDDVQFDKRSWQQRNKIKTAQGPLWLTVPVLTKGRRDQTICEVEISADAKFPDAMLRSVALSYAKARYFDRYFAGFEAIMRMPDHGLCSLNTALIIWLAEAFGITTRITNASDTPVTSAKADRLVDLCVAQGVTDYVSPPGSKAYLDESTAFQTAGISLAFFDYSHPQYGQGSGTFEPFMSALDLLFHEGQDGLAVLRSGVPS